MTYMWSLKKIQQTSDCNDEETENKLVVTSGKRGGDKTGQGRTRCKQSFIR